MLHHRKIFALLMITLLLSGCASSSPVSEVVSFDEFTDIESESTPAASNTPISSDRLSIRETPEGFTVTEMPEEESTPAFDEYDVTLMAVGDNLIHMVLSILANKMMVLMISLFCFRELQIF